MARVTVEDCVKRIPNRFDLVMLAAQRARGVSAGAPLTVDRDNDKNPVVALREIAEETVDLKVLEESLVKGLQKHVEYEEPEPEAEPLPGEQELLDSQREESGEPTDQAEMAEDVLSIQEETASAEEAGEVAPEMQEEADELVKPTSEPRFMDEEDLSKDQGR